MGVSALTASLVGLVRRHRADAEITLFIGSSTSDPERIRLGQAAVTVRVRNYRLSLQARPEEHLLVIALLACAWRMSPWRTLRRWIERRNSWIREMIACRFVGDISGGDSFSDIYGFTRFLVTIAPALVAITLRRPLVLLPQTLGPYKHLLTRIISRAIIRRARRVLCRDWDSVSLAKVVRRDDGDEVVHFCPDVAFSLEPSEAPLSGIRPPVGAGTVAKLLGVNVNALMYHGGYGRGDMFGLRMDYEGFLRSLLCAVVRAGWTVILIPHNYGPPRGVNNDLDVCVDLAASAPSDVRRRLHVLALRCGESELKAAIGLCSFFVGSRMHSCILNSRKSCN